LEGIDSARLEAQLLAAAAAGHDRAWVLTHAEEEFSSEGANALIDRRSAGEPLAYILGWREFFGRNFEVGPSVLIPRHETETLIECAIDEISSRPPGCTVLDLGTGSGCVAITLALECPDALVTAVDISPDALTCASSNASRLGAKVRLLKSDCFDALGDERFDLIATNPPYVGLTEVLPREVADHEPSIALYSGPTGTEFYERLAAQTPNHLGDGGRLLMEVGHRQAAAVRALFVNAGWRHERTKADLAGIPRVVSVSR
jgi:release factor glutamine methyltransferase